MAVEGYVIGSERLGCMVAGLICKCCFAGAFSGVKIATKATMNCLGQVVGVKKFLNVSRGSFAK